MKRLSFILVILLAFAKSAHGALCKNVKGVVAKSTSEYVVIKPKDGKSVQINLGQLDVEQRQQIIQAMRVRKKGPRPFHLCITFDAISE